MTKELEGLKEGLEVEIYIDLLKTTLKTYQIGKCQVLIYSGSLQGKQPKQLQTHNLPTHDVENINSTNKGRD